MSNAASSSLARQLGSLFEGGSAAGLSDRQLLDRFGSGRDEAAFAALVARHGPMVLGVCRQLLGDVQHAEDAFQAVFLVLARQAPALRDADLLGNWLYGVALRTARKARTRDLRRRQAEARGAGRRAVPGLPPPDRALLDRERAEALHGEIDRLPRAFRMPVVLCYFEGLTLDEAARRLRWPVGTTRSRLARAREKLRRGLDRRGVALSAAAMTAALVPRGAEASVSPLLCDSTIGAAIRFAARPAAREALTASTTALAREVLKSMMIHKLRTVAPAVVLAGAVLVGAAAYALGALSNPREGEPPGEPKVQAAPTEPRAPDPDRPAPGRMTVVGRVLSPDGKPMAGVPVNVIGRPREPWVASRVKIERRDLIGRGETDADGRFRFDALRTASTRFFEVDAVAAAPGFGVGWARLNPDADRPSAELRLQPERILRGRVVDINGRPVAGLSLRVNRVGRPTRVGTFEGVNVGDWPPEGFHAWPRPVVTDKNGRFTLAGIGRGTPAVLAVRDDLRFARQGLSVGSDESGDREATLVVRPATIIEGRVVAADTGRPIPDAGISIGAGQSEISGMGITHFRADGQGRYTANPLPGAYFRVSAAPPDGQPYLVTSAQFAWAKGTVRRELDLKLPRGVPLRGTVTNAATGRPLAGAAVQFLAARKPDQIVDGDDAVVASKEDGSFQIAVLPGKGHLFVYGPTADYLLESIGSRMLYYGQPGGERYYAHKIIPYDVKAGDDPEAIAAGLRPGGTVKGHVVGPDGQTVDNAEIIALLHFNYFHLQWRGDLTIHVRDGRFELHGLDPEKPTPASFLDAEHEWGATVELSGKQAGEDVTIRLQPCGKAKARFVGPDGKPVARIYPRLYILGSPGPDIWSRDPNDKSRLAADAAYITNVDRKHYWRGALTDADGRITLPDLIPGATYRICDDSDRAEKGVRVRKDFTVKPGETVDLGEILIEKPAT